MSEQVRISRADTQAMLAIRAPLAEVRQGLEAVLPMPVPNTLRYTKELDETLAWFSPDELLLICSRDRLAARRDALAQALVGTHHLLADMSDARVMFRLLGTRTREVLAKLMPIDVHPDVFGPDHVRRTQLGQVAAAVWMPAEDRAEILCFRSVADYVGQSLATAANPKAAVGHCVNSAPRS